MFHSTPNLQSRPAGLPWASDLPINPTMELTLADFVLIVLSASFAMVVLFTLVSRTLHARAESRSLAHRVVCRLCLHAF